MEVDLVGALIYLATNTRPDICYAVNTVARFMHKPDQQHWEATRKKMRYVAGTADHGITLGGENLQLSGWSDAAHATTEDCHSILAYVVMLGKGPISW